jgi:hypothetical protein
MKSFCANCGQPHDPDVACYDTTEQMKRDIGIRPQKGKGNGALPQKTIWLMVGLFVVMLLAGSLFFWLAL